MPPTLSSKQCTLVPLPSGTSQDNCRYSGLSLSRLKEPWNDSAESLSDELSQMENAGLLTRERFGKHVCLTQLGRETAHCLGVDIPSPVIDSQLLLDYLVPKTAPTETDRTVSRDDIRRALEFSKPRALDAAEALESTGHVTIDHFAGGFHLTVSSLGRLRR